MEKTAETIEEQPMSLRLLLSCGTIGPLFFIIVFLIEGAVRPDYNPLRHPVSSLSFGEYGWIQAANFVITGLLLLAFAVGLRLAFRSSGGSFWGPVLIGLAGIGLIGAGLFTADPFNGYPPGTPLIPTERTVHGVIHDLFGVPVFLGLPVACFVFSRWFARRGERGWALYLVLSGLAMLVFFVLTSMGLNQVQGLAGYAGLLQRLTIIIGMIWITLLAVHLLQTPIQVSQKSE